MESNNNISTSDDGKTAGIISYLSPVGWLIAYFAMHADKKTEQGSYQLRQTLLLYIVMFGFYIAWYIFFIVLLFSFFTSLILLSLLSIVMWLVALGFFVLWLIGLIGAVNGQKKPIPLIGDKAQAMFPGI
jgi:hypothetical protein